MNRNHDAPSSRDDVPVGNCPPRSKSIVVIAAVVFATWFAFLIYMMVHRITHAIR
jgi:hypothetical protein